MTAETIAVFLTPTDSCNLVCRCPSPSLKCRHFMDLDVVTRVLDEVAADPLFHKRVTWSEFGEAFLHAQNFEMLEYAKSLGLTIYLYTNLTILSADDRSRLAATLSAGDVICLNLEWGKRVFEQTRLNSPYDQKLEHTFHVITENKKKPAAERSRIEVWSIDYDIVTEADRIQYYADMREICAAKGLIYEIDEDPTTHDQDADVFFARRWESNWKDFRKISGEPVCAGMLAPQLHVHASGAVGICCHDWHAEARVGAVKRDSLRAIWESQNRAQLYESIEDGTVAHKVCRRCLMCAAPKAVTV